MYRIVVIYCSMVLSLAALEKLVSADLCYCSSADAPDDMTIGLCLRHLRINITHSPLFHQVTSPPPRTLLFRQVLLPPRTLTSPTLCSCITWSQKVCVVATSVCVTVHGLLSIALLYFLTLIYHVLRWIQTPAKLYRCMWRGWSLTLVGLLMVQLSVHLGLAAPSHMSPLVACNGAMALPNPSWMIAVLQRAGLWRHWAGCCCSEKGLFVFSIQDWRKGPTPFPATDPYIIAN